MLGASPGCIPDIAPAGRPLVHCLSYSPCSRARRACDLPPHVSSPTGLRVHSGGLCLHGSSRTRQHRITRHTPSCAQWRTRDISIGMQCFVCDMSFSCCRRVKCMMHSARVDYRPFSACPKINARPNLDLSQMMVVLVCWFFLCFTACLPHSHAFSSMSSRLAFCLSFAC